MTITTKDGTTDNINTVIATSPGATQLLQVVPVILVQVMVLRTDIGHEECLFLSRTVPLVVTSRTHVTTVVARLHIVESSDWIMRIFIWHKRDTLTLTLTIGMILGEIPRHGKGDTHSLGIPYFISITL
jgi:hypothetical protein